MHLVDTSVWIHVLRRPGIARIQQLLKPMIVGGNAAITEWILLELMVGIRTSESADSLIRKMEPLHRLPFPAEKWNEAWKLATSLRKEGISASASDCFISIVAIAHEATLVHCDADFELIAGHSKLQTLDWTPHASTLKKGSAGTGH